MNARFLTKTQFTGARLAIKAAQRTRSNMRMGARAEVGLFYSTSTGKNNEKERKKKRTEQNGVQAWRVLCCVLKRANEHLPLASFFLLLFFLVPLGGTWTEYWLFSLSFFLSALLPSYLVFVFEGNTEAAADWIKAKFSGEITDPTDIGEVDISDLEGYSSLIVGAPTWNTGADEGRSGTAWDEVLDEIRDLDLGGKKVAVFGCGDSSSYGDYFCDAIEEVYSAMKDAGASMVGFVDPSGYDFAESKSVLDGKFCGLPLDEDNESDMTEDRVAAWCEQISGEGLA